MTTVRKQVLEADGPLFWYSVPITFFHYVEYTDVSFIDKSECEDVYFLLKKYHPKIPVFTTIMHSTGPDAWTNALWTESYPSSPKHIWAMSERIHSLSNSMMELPLRIRVMCKSTARQPSLAKEHWSVVERLEGLASAAIQITNQVTVF